jgi:hypothetical protein
VGTANTWTFVVVTIPGDTGGTWVGNTTAGAASVNFSLGAGSTYNGTAGAWATGNYISVSGSVSVVGTNAAVFDITGVQLEPGSTPTSFERRAYADELAKCQRYAFKTYSQGVAVGTASTSGYPIWTAIAQTCYWQYSLPVQMRSPPTVYYYAYDGTAGDWTINGVDTAVTLQSASTQSVSTTATGVAPYAIGHFLAISEL